MSKNTHKRTRTLGLRPEDRVTGYIRPREYRQGCSLEPSERYLSVEVTDRDETDRFTRLDLSLEDADRLIERLTHEVTRHREAAAKESARIAEYLSLVGLA